MQRRIFSLGLIAILAGFQLSAPAAIRRNGIRAEGAATKGGVSNGSLRH